MQSRSEAPERPGRDGDCTDPTGAEGPADALPARRDGPPEAEVFADQVPDDVADESPPPSRPPTARLVTVRPGPSFEVLGAVAAGGVLGALARHAVDLGVPTTTGGFPLSTFLVNAGGCLLIGALAGLVRHPHAHRLLLPFVVTGVLGGFTTFSTYAVQTVDLALRGQVDLAVGYLLGTLVVALGAVWTGLVTTRWFAHGRHQARYQLRPPLSGPPPYPPPGYPSPVWGPVPYGPPGHPGSAYSGAAPGAVPYGLPPYAGAPHGPLPYPPLPGHPPPGFGPPPDYGPPGYGPPPGYASPGYGPPPGSVAPPGFVPPTRAGGPPYGPGAYGVVPAIWPASGPPIPPTGPPAGHRPPVAAPGTFSPWARPQEDAR